MLPVAQQPHFSPPAQQPVATILTPSLFLAAVQDRQDRNGTRAGQAAAVSEGATGRAGAPARAPTVGMTGGDGVSLCEEESPSAHTSLAGIAGEAPLHRRRPSQDAAAVKYRTGISSQGCAGVTGRLCCQVQQLRDIAVRRWHVSFHVLSRRRVAPPPTAAAFTNKFPALDIFLNKVLFLWDIN